jgi:hypothetical protein
VNKFLPRRKRIVKGFVVAITAIYERKIPKIKMLTWMPPLLLE